MLKPITFPRCLPRLTINCHSILHMKWLTIFSLMELWKSSIHFYLGTLFQHIKLQEVFVMAIQFCRMAIFVTCKGNEEQYERIHWSKLLIWDLKAVAIAQIRGVDSW